MSTILITWELGGALGHLTPLAPIVQALSAEGHQIFAAVRDLTHIDTIFANLGVRYVQCPIKLSPASPLIETPRTFAHILHNCGYAQQAELQALADGWRNLIQFIEPDLILFDHSPTAMLAARTCSAKRAVIGTGFCCPPDDGPMSDLRPWLGDASASLEQDEQRVLQHVNGVLTRWGLKPLVFLSQLYGEVDQTILATFRELDMYENRKAADYFGAWPATGGEVPRWPNQPGKRVFAYLKGFHAIHELLLAIQQLHTPTLIYMDALSQKARETFESPYVHFADNRLDLRMVCQSCDMGLLNGGHNTTALMLLSGKPTIHVPLNLEQAYNGSSVAKLNAGRGALPDRPDEFLAILEHVLNGQEYLHGAKQFANKYASYLPEKQIERASQALLDLL
jgi:hypothetical protein